MNYAKICKEHLYMEIAGRLQKKMWQEMTEFLETNRGLAPKELTKQCFIWMFTQIERYPMLKQADHEIAEYLYRKLPQEHIQKTTAPFSRYITLVKSLLHGVLYNNVEISPLSGSVYILAVWDDFQERGANNR